MLLETIAAAFVVLLLVVAGMAVGVILSGRRIAGSCGGLSAIDGVDRCDLCGRDVSDAAQSDCGKKV
ncbi:(Na+)-NQR maturation NqrM [Denitrobaculum tricleocarpae]|uniref:(Na+)-NQR maturation NqrM n=1 Tax=Denitrobaculum tricleocarpae TaxID=2591009 RepID=A0A545TB03_9PROT|nr:(Na+)-NQR maturation NqrM [Denitrobaculum tricleocarpae]TQV74381.1 (Na+)-NQR maturation NqrM [Denitrobaculum tricleocarpae]